MQVLHSLCFVQGAGNEPDLMFCVLCSLAIKTILRTQAVAGSGKISLQKGLYNWTYGKETAAHAYFCWVNTEEITLSLPKK